MTSKESKPLDPSVVLDWHGEACLELAFEIVAGSRRPPADLPLAGRVEHTCLKPEASPAELERLCAEALEHRFRAVCCLPRDVALCRGLLGGSGVLVASVVDFPLGVGTAGEGAAQCGQAVGDGADEIDMVIDQRALAAGRLDIARAGVARVVEAADGRPVKVILETGAFDERQVVRGCAAAEAGGAMFVKTSTGYGPRGASVEDVALMRVAVGNRLGIKAAGGIKVRADALALVDAGADLLGTSSGPACI